MRKLSTLRIDQVMPIAKTQKKKARIKCRPDWGVRFYGVATGNYSIHTITA